MEKSGRLITAIIIGVLGFPCRLIAQNAETYIDNLEVQDSTFLEAPMILNESQNSGLGTSSIVIIVVVVVIIIAVVGYLAMKKKKK
jgi:hypothetical protein